MSRLIPMDQYIKELIDRKSGTARPDWGSGSEAVLGPIRQWAKHVVVMEDVVLDPQRRTHYDQRRAWCDDNCQGIWANLGPVYYFFELERDAVLFRTFHG